MRNVENLEMSTVGRGIWQKEKARKTWKNKNAHCRTWNMAKNTEKRGNEKCTL